MSFRAPQWPTIIAFLVGGLGLSTLCRAWPVAWGPQVTWMTCDWSAIVAAAFLFALSLLAATGRNWARWVLLSVVIVVGVFQLIVHGGKAMGPLTISDLRPDQADMVRLRWRLTDFSSFFFYLALLIFAVLFLCHPQVAGSFRDRSGSSQKV